MASEFISGIVKETDCLFFSLSIALSRAIYPCIWWWTGREFAPIFANFDINCSISMKLLLVSVAKTWWQLHCILIITVINWDNFWMGEAHQWWLCCQS